MTSCRSIIVSLGLLAALRVAAYAQPATAQAEHLFREGKRLMGEGNIAAACEAFEGSYAKDPAVTTLLNLADCKEKNQQYASAWSYFVEAGRPARTGPDAEALRKIAHDRASTVEAKLSYLIINVPNDAQVEGLTITRNGIPVDPVEWNRDIPIDGGDYRIEGKAPAYEAWSTTVKVENAKDKQSVNVPRFRQALTATGSPEPAGGDDRRSSFTGKRKLAVGLWALGAVGLGGAAAFELKSGGTYEDAKSSMDNAERHELTDQANRERRFALGAGAAGVVAIGVGLWLWIDGSPSAGLALTPD